MRTIGPLFYNANGNLTGDGTSSYAWNARNQLTAISGGATASFVYDALGRRESKTFASTSTKFLYDGLNIEQELNGTTPTVNYLTCANIDEVFSRTDSTGSYSYLTDNLGSTLALTNSAGAISTSYSYEPYGNTTTSGTTSGNAIQYTGRENDGDGLYYYRARYYSPGYSRFISQDPVGLLGGPNLYGYAGSDPMDFNDPYGLWRWGDPLPQDLVDFSEGFGDGVSRILTFGLYSTSDFRREMGIDGGVNPCSGWYLGGKYTGYAWGMGTMWAAGLNGGSNSAFWAGRGASQTAETFGVTITDTPIGALLDGLGIENRTVWTIASATFAGNASGTADAVITYAAPNSIWWTEQAILNWRGIPIIFH